MYGVITKESYTTDGGHGYGVYSTDYDSFREFKDEAEMLDFVKRNPHRTHRLIQFEPVEIETTVVVKKKPVVRDDRDRIVNR